MSEQQNYSELTDFPVVIQIPVQWGDQDLFEHVNNTIPIRWFESARLVYLERCGLSELMATQRVGPILASMTADFRRQIQYPDSVHVGARITGVGHTSMTMEHAIVSQSQGATAVQGVSVVVVFDYEAQRPVPIPDGVRSSIETLENRSFP